MRIFCFSQQQIPNNQNVCVVNSMFVFLRDDKAQAAAKLSIFAIIKINDC